MKFEFVTETALKAAIVKEVLYDLPEWFGLPESTQRYIDESESLPLWSATINDEPVGFVILKETSESTAEIHCMGVKRNITIRGLEQLCSKN